MVPRQNVHGQRVVIEAGLMKGNSSYASDDENDASLIEVEA